MKIQIDNKNEIRFGDRRLTYDLYHLTVDKYDAPTLGGVMKNIILDWVKVLDSPSKVQRLFLPYDFDDHWIDCLEADISNDKIVFNSVRLREPGWAADFGNLEAFILTPHEIEEGSTDFIGKFDRDEIIAALLNAEVVDR